MPLTRLQEYRKAAQEARRYAETAVSDKDREQWLKIAAEWEGLARSAEASFNRGGTNVSEFPKKR